MILVDEREMYKIFKNATEVLTDQCKELKNEIGAKEETIQLLNERIENLKRKLENE